MTSEPAKEKSLAAHDIAKIFPAIGADKAPLTFEQFQVAQADSCKDVAAFWDIEAKKRLDWFAPYTSVLQGDLTAGDITWFAGGKLNVSYNAIDRHVAAGKGSQVAMIWEGDEVTDVRRLTYTDLQRKVSQIANALTVKGVKYGDVVTVYMPMIPELAMTMLACTRIGAVHSVVFAGFSAEALGSRISAANSKFLVTADQGKRGGKTIALKDIVDKARTVMNCEDILEQVLVFERFYKKDTDAAADAAAAADDDAVPAEKVVEDPNKAPTYTMKPKDVRMDLLVQQQRPYSVPVWMDAEDNLFLLYTSGSTGTPKGLVHTVGGYTLYAAFTAQTTFDLQDGDIFACVADCGWITGHTYVVYGPLLNGGTTFLFESTPVYPDPGRYWDMVQRHKITQFYTAPTAIRLLMRYGDEHPKKYDTSSLKVLGTVGEPINPEAWRWYYEVVGEQKCTVVDTYWQTETGGHVLTNLPGITPMKPGSCTMGSYGIDTVVLDSVTGKPATERDEHGNLKGVMAIRQPWPGMARTCLGDHERFLQTYLHVYPGYYFTGDSVLCDKDGYYFIIGRVDDVLNVSGHRIGTAEVESALVAHAAVAQAAVVGQPHEIKGQAIAAFCMLVEGAEESEQLVKDLRSLVRREIGGFAMPDMIVITPSLPMTRSGKIMRRILRKIVCGEVDELGDTSTLADPSIVDVLIEKVAITQGKK